MPTTPTDRPISGQVSIARNGSIARDGLKRWRYQGRRHQHELFPGYRTPAALLGAAVAAILLLLTVALWSSPRRDNNVVLPEIPRASLTFTPSLPAPADPDASPAPPADGSSATAVPPAPPLPPESPDPPEATAKPAPPATPKPPPPHHIPVTAFEAESAANTLFGQARIRNNTNASGGQAIGFLGTNDRGVSGSLRVNGLTVPTPGTYTLTVFYISGNGDRDARIRVNGTLLASITFPSTGDWDTVGSMTLRIRAVAGRNSVEFDNPTDRAPDIDRVVLSN